jgi:predicted TIM-barrel fold metal-dependent hydrolase
MEVPGIRFLMAHGSWPWVDECIAVALKFKCWHRARGLPGEPQATIDTTRGTPPIYRRALLEKAAAVVGVERMVYGSDHCADTMGNDAGWKEDLRICREELNWSDAHIRAYLRDNLDRFLSRK